MIRWRPLVAVQNSSRDRRVTYTGHSPSHTNLSFSTTVKKLNTLSAWWLIFRKQPICQKDGDVLVTAQTRYFVQRGKTWNRARAGYGYSGDLACPVRCIA